MKILELFSYIPDPISDNVEVLRDTFKFHPIGFYVSHIISYFCGIISRWYNMVISVVKFQARGNLDFLQQIVLFLSHRCTRAISLSKEGFNMIIQINHLWKSSFIQNRPNQTLFHWEQNQHFLWICSFLAKKST